MGVVELNLVIKLDFLEARAAEKGEGFQRDGAVDFDLFKRGAIPERALADGFERRWKPYLGKSRTAFKRALADRSYPIGNVTVSKAAQESLCILVDDAITLCRIDWVTVREENGDTGCVCGEGSDIEIFER